MHQAGHDRSAIRPGTQRSTTTFGRDFWTYLHATAARAPDGITHGSNNTYRRKMCRRVFFCSGDLVVFLRVPRRLDPAHTTRAHAHAHALARQQVAHKTTTSKGKGVVGGPKLETVTPPLPPKPQVLHCSTHVACARAARKNGLARSGAIRMGRYGRSVYFRPSLRQQQLQHPPEYSRKRERERERERDRQRQRDREGEIDVLVVVLDRGMVVR